ncbi:MAG: hypothetical protein WA510_06385, partial [Acidobacteriaceae bacterium]
MKTARIDGVVCAVVFCGSSVLTALAQDAARPHEVTRPRRRNGLHMLLAEDNRSNQTVALRA